MLLSKKELEELSQVDPIIVEYLKQNPPPALPDIASMRAAMAARDLELVNRAGPLDTTILEEKYVDITLRDGYVSKLKVCKPIGTPAGGFPVIVHAFGGGFIRGDVEQFTAMARLLAKRLSVVVVSISYRLAPEHLFPTAHLDAWDSCKWIAQHAEDLGANLGLGFILGGVSAGASIMSAVITNAISEPLAHPVTGQWLAIPSLFDADSVPEKYRDHHLSMKHNADAPGLNAAAVHRLNGVSGMDPSSPWRYPINSPNPLSKQPRAFFTVDGSDPIRDDALIWDELLKDAGVETRVDLYPGCPHGHWTSFHGLEISKRTVADILRGMAWLLGREVSQEEATSLAF